MNNKQSEPKIYCIFNDTKEDPYIQIGKAFEIYLKDLKEQTEHD